MKYLKSILIVLLVAILPFSVLACSDKNDDKNTKVFVGIAIYQKLDGNLNWEKFNNKPNAVNNLISTINDKIVLDEEPELLFFVYSQNEITSNTTDKDFISNTTKDKVTIKDNTLSFRLERIIEDTEILVYYIYKLNSSDYYLEYKDSKSNITNETEVFEFDTTNNHFSKIKITLETNLTIKDEY